MTWQGWVYNVFYALEIANLCGVYRAFFNFFKKRAV